MGELVLLFDKTIGSSRGPGPSASRVRFDAGRQLLLIDGKLEPLQMPVSSVSVVVALQVERSFVVYSVKGADKLLNFERPTHQVTESVSSVVLASDRLPEDLQQRLEELAGGAHKRDPDTYKSFSLRVLDDFATSVIDRTDPASAWYGAEIIAKAIGVPMLDLLGEDPIYREVHELDMPLGQRLARRGIEPRVPEAGLPRGFELERGDALALSWRDPGTGFFARLFGAGDYALVLDDAGIVAFKGDKELGAIPIDELEAVRCDAEGLSLLSDRCVIGCPISDWNAASWTRELLEHELWQRAQRGGTAPYR